MQDNGYSESQACDVQSYCDTDMRCNGVKPVQGLLRKVSVVASH